MLIGKIAENKLEIIINLDDLIRNNTNIESFMACSIESQPIFLEILNIVNKKIGVNIKDYKILVDSFAVPSKDIFILIITRASCKNYSLSKVKYKKLKLFMPFVATFNNFEDFCMFCKSFNNYFKIESSLYLLNNYYYLFLHIKKLQYVKSTLLNLSEFSNNINQQLFINENSKVIIKNCAIETCLKYFFSQSY